MPAPLKAALLAATLMLPSRAVIAQDDTVPGQVLGPWLTGEQGAVIELYRCGDSGAEELCGRIVWLEEPYTDDGRLKRDTQNPAPSLRDRPRCGLEVVTGLARKDDGDTWTGGRVYNPQDGKRYKARLKAGDGEQLTIRVYLGIPLIGKSETWTRPGQDIELGCPEQPAATVPRH